LVCRHGRVREFVDIFRSRVAIVDGQAQELSAFVEESEIDAPCVYADRVEFDGSVSAQAERF